MKTGFTVNNVWRDVDTGAFMISRIRIHFGFIVCVTFLLFANGAVAQRDDQLKLLEPDADAVARLGDEFKNGKFSIRPISGLKAAGIARPELQDSAMFIYAWTPDGILDGVANFTVGLTPFAQPSSENLDSTLKGMKIDIQNIHARRHNGVEVRFGHYKLQIDEQDVIAHLLLGIDSRGTYAVTCLTHQEEATPARIEEIEASLMTFRRTGTGMQNQESGADWTDAPTHTLEPIKASAGSFRIADAEFDLTWNAPSEPKVTKRDSKSLTYEVTQDQVQITLTIRKQGAMIQSARFSYIDTIESIQARGWKKAKIPFVVEPVAHLKYLGMIGRLKRVTTPKENLVFADFRGESVALNVTASGPKDKLVPMVKSVIQSVRVGKLDSHEGPLESTPANPSKLDTPTQLKPNN